VVQGRSSAGFVALVHGPIQGISRSLNDTTVVVDFVIEPDRDDGIEENLVEEAVDAIRADR
jgi:hypothetical protein